MFNLLLACIIVAIVVDSVVDGIQRSDLFAEFRDYLETSDGIIGRIIGCAMCLSYWAAGWVSLLITPAFEPVSFLQWSSYWLLMTLAGQTLYFKILRPVFQEHYEPDWIDDPTD